MESRDRDYAGRGMTESEKIEADSERAFGWLIAPLFTAALVVYGYYANDVHIIIIGILLTVVEYVPIIYNMKKSKCKRDSWIESRERRAEQQKLEDSVQENNYFHNMK